MKAVFYSQGSRVVLGHSVRELAIQGEKIDPSFANLRETSALRDQFYIPTRYPNGLPSPAIPSQSYTASQADMALQAAEQVIETVRAFLSIHTDVLKEEE